MKKPILKNGPMPFWAVCIVVAVLAVPVCLGLMQGHLIDGSDAKAALTMALYMDQFTGNGQWYIRWASHINFGYGYPMFDFYPPFFYFLTFLLGRIVHDVVLSMNLCCIVFWVLSGVSMYLLAKEFWGWKGGLLAAVAYMYAPYHVQDLYVRTDFAEFSACAFFPLLLWALYKIYHDGRVRYVLAAALSVWVLGLAHTLMFMLFIPIAAVYLAFLFLLDKNAQALGQGFLAMAVGFMMSAFYWLPAFWDKQYLNTNFLISMRNDFHKHFVTWGQLLHWPWGNTFDSDGMSFQIGMVPLVLALLPLGLMAVSFQRNRRLAWNHLFFFCMALGAVLFTLPVSHLLWENIPLLKFVQFPWRFLAIICFAVSLLAGGFMMMFKGKAANVVLAVAVVLVIVPSIKFFWPIHVVDVDQTTAKKIISSNIFLGEGVSTPKWIKIPPLKPPLQKFEFVHGQGKVLQDKTVNAIEHVAKIQASQLSLVCFHSFYFPGWRVFIDGQQTTIYPDNPYGLILFVVLPGEHTVRVVFGSTPVRTAAVAISWAGLAALLLVMALGYGRGEKAKTSP